MLHGMSPELIYVSPTTKINNISIHQGLSCFNDALQCVVDSWIEDKTKRDEFSNPHNEVVGLMVAMLECINKAAKGKFELVYEEKPTHDNIKENNSDSDKYASKGGSYSYSPPRLLNLRVQALEKLGPKDIKQMAFHMAPANTNNKTMLSEKSKVEADGQVMIKHVTAPSPPPPMIGKGGPPPAPMTKGAVGGPPSASKSTTKLKRSINIGKLYRLLRGKFEGSNHVAAGKSSTGKKSTSSGGKGLAGALEEMANRSDYLKQIEADVQKHGEAIKELGITLSAFKTKDMEELLKFHKHVESQLGVFSDENKVLSRFKEFPLEKLETVRSAAALSIRLNNMASEMQNWKAALPLDDSFDKVEKYFDKTKKILEELESNKDKKSEQFQKNNIQFDFNVFTKVRESMVDLSSGFIELALKHRREAKAKTSDENWYKAGGKQMLSAKMLWRAVQFAYKVYSFAGGHDERADTLTREVAKEFETDPMHGK